MKEPLSPFGQEGSLRGSTEGQFTKAHDSGGLCGVLPLQACDQKSPRAISSRQWPRGKLALGSREDTGIQANRGGVPHPKAESYGEVADLGDEKLTLRPFHFDVEPPNEDVSVSDLDFRENILPIDADVNNCKPQIQWHLLFRPSKSPSFPFSRAL